MQSIDLKLSEIIPYERNPRFNDDAVDAIAKSIAEFGFLNPIVVDSNHVIICGHTRFKAAQKLGLVSVPVIVADSLSEDQVKAFRRIAAMGKPIILCQHVPFYTPGICRAGKRWWKKGTDEAAPELKLPDFQRQRSDPATCEFIEYLKGEPLLKGILSGHLHMFAEDRFSPTAMQYVAGGNFSFLGQVVRVT